MAKNTEDGIKIVVSITPEQSKVLRRHFVAAVTSDGAPGRMGPGTVLSAAVRSILDPSADPGVAQGLLNEFLSRDGKAPEAPVAQAQVQQDDEIAAALLND